MEQRLVPESSGDTRPTVSTVPFSEIPGQSRLFVDYQRDPEALKNFYPGAVKSVADLTGRVPVVLNNFRVDRRALVDALLRQRANVRAGDATLRNIERLADARTVAVVTGQQAGLFTGPLYTIYKALTAVKMAAELETAGIKAVPVFWIASEDHDLAEVSHVSVVGPEGIRQISYKAADEFNGRAVGDVVLDNSIDAAIGKLIEDLPPSEYTVEIAASLGRCWTMGNGFASAFGEDLAQLLASFGLVFIDPLDPQIKRLASPIYKAAVTACDEIVERIRERSEELVADGYHAQVLVKDDYFPLFWHDDDGRRTSLRKAGDGLYRAAAARLEFSVDELVTISVDTPERLSPGVMLRPVVQDYLLPTLCYVGGGAEIAYFAQNSVVYETLQRPVTTILHRQSFTVAGPRQSRNLKKLGIEFRDLFQGAERVRERLARENFPADAESTFDGVESGIDSELDRLADLLKHIDPTLADSVAKKRQKIDYHVAALKRKAVTASARRSEIIGDQLDDLLATLWPDDALQERSLNVYQFISKLGPSFVDLIYAAIDLDDRGHRVVQL